MIGKPRESKPSNTLYQQVLTKNFQIIEAFLTQFHQIFLKQDQFQAILGKFEHRLSIIQRGSKKNQQLISRSSEMYQKKMTSLKQYILEKLKGSGQKVQYLKVEPQIRNNDQEQNNIGKQIFQQYQKQLSQQKKLQQNVNQHIKKIDLQIININMKLNSISAITSNLDERMRFSINLQDKGPTNHQANLTKQIQASFKIKVQELSRKIDNKLIIFQTQIFSLSKQMIERINRIDSKISQKEAQIKSKLSSDQFYEFKTTYKDDQSCIIKEIGQNFANKKETKKMFHLLEKKLLKLEIIQQIIKQNNENDCNISVMPANYYSRSRPNSIHSHKKAQKQQINAKDSLFIRRLNSRKKNKDVL